MNIILTHTYMPNIQERIMATIRNEQDVPQSIDTDITIFSTEEMLIINNALNIVKNKEANILRIEGAPFYIDIDIITSNQLFNIVSTNWSDLTTEEQNNATLFYDLLKNKILTL